MFEKYIDNLISWIWGEKGFRVLTIIIIAYLSNYLLKFFLRRVVRGASKSLTKANERRIETFLSTFWSTIAFVIWVVAVLMILPELGVKNIEPLLAGAGIAGLAIGMGARSLIQDYLSGLFILLEDQYRIGEEIQILDFKGKVKDINLRRTVLKDEEGRIFFVPNGQITKVINLSRGRKD